MDHSRAPMTAPAILTHALSGLRRYGFATGLVLSSLALPVYAAAPVAEIGAAVGGRQAVPATGVPAASPQVETYYLLQSLRDELRDLRGMLEEQGHALQQLKQRQVDDYIDLDRRLSGLATGAASVPVVAGGSIPLAPVLPSVPASDSGDKAVYQQAYRLLKAGQVPDALAAFKAYLGKYPVGSYVANAQYWMGEIYTLNNQLPEAGAAFRVVVEQFPAHRKMLDASFKLGKVYHLQGENEKAKVLLSRVAATQGSAGKLAGDYLKANF